VFRDGVQAGRVLGLNLFFLLRACFFCSALFCFLLSTTVIASTFAAVRSGAVVGSSVGLAMGSVLGVLLESVMGSVLGLAVGLCSCNRTRWMLSYLL
jgi:hypothetical protein